MPQVTVLMPVYNSEKYLDEAINSILQQTFTDFDFLIIDDGSTDKSIDIIKSYRDTRIKLIQNLSNLGLVETLNLGMSLSTTEYVARMDADDISFKDRLRRQVDFLESNPDISLLGTNAQIIDTNGNTRETCNIVSSDLLIKWQMFFNCPLIHPTVMMRKYNIDTVDCYSCDEIKGREKYSGEDYNLWRKVASKFKIDNLQDTLLYLRKHNKNLTINYLTEHIRNASTINNLVIREYVGISLEKTYCLFVNQYQSNQQIFESVILIFRIYQSFIKKHDLQFSLRKEISRDAAIRILNLISTHYRQSPKLLLLLFLLIYLEPYILLHKAKNIIIKTITSK